jgi:glycosyltransferase involved in cell wall biosynthesis
MSLLASCWAEQGRQVTLLTFERANACSSSCRIHASVKIKKLGLESVSSHVVDAILRNLWRLYILRRAIQESEADIVVSFVDIINVLTIIATRRMFKPIIVSERVDPSRHSIGPAWRFLRQLVYPLADALVCQTTSALAQFRIARKNIGAVIPNMVTVPLSSTKNYGSSAGRIGRRTIIGMGRLVHQKGFDLLLRSFAVIATRHPDWSVLILGDGPLRQELETQVERLKLTARVKFLGAVDDPISVLRQADLFVLSSRFEGFPNALCEAMACGLPVVSFDCPSGPRDIIRNGLDGILVPADDVDRLAAAMDRLASSEQERQRMGDRATEVLVRFSQQRILTLWEELFAQVAKRKVLAKREVPNSIRSRRHGLPTLVGVSSEPASSNNGKSQSQVGK